jgi:hypothetical protein
MQCGDCGLNRRIRYHRLTRLLTLPVPLLSLPYKVIFHPGVRPEVNAEGGLAEEHEKNIADTTK